MQTQSPTVPVVDLNAGDTFVYLGDVHERMSAIPNGSPGTVPAVRLSDGVLLEFQEQQPVVVSAYQAVPVS